MLSVVCCLWNDGYRGKSGKTEYKPEYVNVLRRMVARHLTVPHRFICISDTQGGFDDGIDVMPWPGAALALAGFKNPQGEQYPNSYRRLWLFSDEAKILGERILLLDVDLVILGKIDFLVNRQEDFVGWKPKRASGTKFPRVAGGSWLLRTGTHTFVHDDFKGQESIDLHHSEGYGGSDQGWISHCLADTCAEWKTGISSSARRENGAVIVHCNGDRKPWALPRRHIWVKKFWK